MKPLILASASPRRKRMFEELGLLFEVMPADIEELMQKGENSTDYAKRTALEKGRAVAVKLKEEGRNPWIVAADTIVLLGDQVLFKPNNSDQARGMLHKLKGQTHTVVTGWAIGRPNGEWLVKHAETMVTFLDLGDDQIDTYVATGEGMDKAGAYAIQGLGAFLVKSITGNYSNVVGLPVSHVVQDLIDLGALPTFPMP